MYVLLMLSCLPLSVSSRDYFTAAVFEHSPRNDDNYEDPHKIITSNMIYYEKAITEASQKGADIILFNEFGLFPYLGTRENFKRFAESVPDPTEIAFNPCSANATDRFILHTLSCLAKANQIHIVANMIDIEECEPFCDALDGCSEPCPEDGVLMYNTDVAFDPQGTIIARYHKCHPYFEVLNVPDEPQFVTFETKFGTFGMIICFDSVFEESAILARSVDTLLFPTHWFDDIVPLNGVEWQQAQAIANGVNFMAANTQLPGLGSLGSGIYCKEDGALVYTYEPDGESKLLLANLAAKGSPRPPKDSQIYILRLEEVIPKTETGDKFPSNGFFKVVGRAPDMRTDYRYFKSQTEKYTLVKLSKPFGKLEACSNGFCCSVTYSADTLADDYYLAAFNGLNSVYNGMKGLTYYHWWEESCLLVRCDPVLEQECVVQPPQAKTLFREIELRARFSEGVIYPAVSSTHFRLAPKADWKVLLSNKDTLLHFQSPNGQPLLKVGLLGRIYHKDPPFVPFYKPHDRTIF